MATDKTWESKVASKQAAEAAKIPSEWRLDSTFLVGDETSNESVLEIPRKSGIMTPAELDITEKYNAVALAKAVQSGLIKSVDVARAFCKRAAIAQQLLHCLTETMFDDAIKRGEYLDQYLAEHKRPVGPLHGVPISLKDPFQYVGVASTIGFTSFLDHPLPTENSPLVKILLELGAILYCKTNIPQTMMTGDSQNYVFGRVLNPHKLKLGAGGSSGGEGALVAIRGSILGVGSDIGGSIRIPALANGTYGFKPSSHRVPYGGQVSPAREGSPCFPPVAGPLANSLEDLDFFLRHVIDTKPWNKDYTTLSIPWRHSVPIERSKLRIGFFDSDPDFPTQPPVARALASSVKKLTAAGFTIVPLSTFPSAMTGLTLCTDFFSLDNSKLWLDFIHRSGEPIIPSLQKTLPLINKKPKYTLDEVFELNVAQSRYKAAWNKTFVDNQLDVILCPGAATTAVLHDSYGAPPYTAIWNLVEYPAVILPVGQADQTIDTEDLAKPDPSGRKYNASDSHGAPTAVQIVARQYQDEELMTAATMIDECLRG